MCFLLLFTCLFSRENPALRCLSSRASKGRCTETTVCTPRAEPSAALCALEAVLGPPGRCCIDAVFIEDSLWLSCFGSLQLLFMDTSEVRVDLRESVKHLVLAQLFFLQLVPGAPLSPVMIQDLDKLKNSPMGRFPAGIGANAGRVPFLRLNINVITWVHVNMVSIQQAGMCLTQYEKSYLY